MALLVCKENMAREYTGRWKQIKGRDVKRNPERSQRNSDLMSVLIIYIDKKQDKDYKQK